ncbi:ABC transporter permease [Anaeromicropila populeti]|uniref:ABC-2 type transport system permease protein n=1 Tax=Anaeromicropila populeti TaxID=37658 RepID=A0A1I6JQ62_9FIRM|nr:ABC-2 family transporter protein [Anaeromicropila populeti]SFR80670.1 ABC-2 type transport system permease protein [Anaeromicropila populeti]
MKKYIILYRESIRIAFAAASTYRADFILQSVIIILSNILFPLMTWLIYGAGASFEGWTLYQVLLIQSVFTMSMGVSSMLFTGIVWSTMEHVREGTLEIILIKPVDCMGYLLAATFSIENIGVVFGGAVLFGVALFHLPVPNLFLWFQFLFLFLLGVLVMLGINLLMAATSFKWVANSRIPELYQSVLRFGNYPQKIFSKSIQAITSFLIPVAMVGFFPAAALLQKTDSKMYIAVLPCILFAWVGIALYKYMIRQYEGVGG